MNHKFDELTRSMAQSVTRRSALKKFGFGLASMALACFGLANKGVANPTGSGCGCLSNADCNGSSYCYGGVCLPNWCNILANPHCCKHGKTAWPTCASTWGIHAQYCSFLG